MINVAVSNAMEQAKKDAISNAAADGRRWAVVVGYNDHDELSWQPVPLEEVKSHEEILFCTESMAKVDDPPTHDARCHCGAVVPCTELECVAPALHETTCDDCLARERGEI